MVRTWRENVTCGNANNCIHIYISKVSLRFMLCSLPSAHFLLWAQKCVVQLPIIPFNFPPPQKGTFPYYSLSTHVDNGFQRRCAPCSSHLIPTETVLLWFSLIYCQLKWFTPLSFLLSSFLLRCTLYVTVLKGCRGNMFFCYFVKKDPILQGGCEVSLFLVTYSKLLNKKIFLVGTEVCFTVDSMQSSLSFTSVK